MLSLPAVGACASVGDLDHAHAHLELAQRSAKLWEGTAWEAALAEAESGLALAEGDRARAVELLQQAEARFERAGQPLDVDRCRRLRRAVTV